MGTVGAATAPLWLPTVNAAGLAMGANPVAQEFAKQLMYNSAANLTLNVLARNTDLAAY